MVFTLLMRTVRYVYRFNFDHPSMLCALGMLPGSMVDKRVMLATLEKVLDSWMFEHMWDGLPGYGNDGGKAQSLIRQSIFC